MQTKKYWLRGGILGAIVGIVLGICYFICSADPSATFCDVVGAVPGIVWSVIRSSAMVNSIIAPSDFLELIIIVLPYIVLGIVLGWLYGKLKK